MSFDYGGKSPVQLPPNLAHAVVVKPPADIPVYSARWEAEMPANWRDDLSGAAPAVLEYQAMIDTAFGPVIDDDHWQAGLDFYLNCLRDVDRSMEVVLDALQASGQADRTVVIVTADHGELAGSHRLRQKGNLVYDENTHVPMIMRHPDVSGGTVSDAPGSAVDLALTLLAMAGLDDQTIATTFPGLSGRSLLPALDGNRVRDGVLVAIESVVTLDASFWEHFGDPDVAQRIQSVELRPDWRKRGFLRGYIDELDEVHRLDDTNTGHNVDKASFDDIARWSGLAPQRIGAAPRQVGHMLRHTTLGPGFCHDRNSIWRATSKRNLQGGAGTR
jgi:arylsulfatase